MHIAELNEPMNLGSGELVAINQLVDIYVRVDSGPLQLQRDYNLA